MTRSTGNSRQLTNRTVWVLVTIAALFPPTIWGALHTLGRIEEDPVEWAASDLQAKHDLEWFEEHFGAWDSIILSWPGCVVGDARLERLARAIESVRPRTEDGESGCWFARVVTGTRMLEKMTAPPYDFSHAKAMRRLRGVLIGPDGRSTCAIIPLTQDAVDNASEVVRKVRAIAVEHCGLSPAQLRMTGHVVETVSIDAAVVETLRRESLLSMLVVMAVAWPFVRSFRLALLLILIVAFCQCTSLSLVYYGGQPMNGMLAMIPALILVAFVSNAVHMLNYYSDALHRAEPPQAAQRALRIGLFPCSLAMVTTAAGIGSLSVSHIKPVQLFACFAAIGVLLALIMLLVAVPGAMPLASTRCVLTGRNLLRSDHRQRAKQWFWAFVTRMVVRYDLFLVFLGSSLIVAGSFGLLYLRGSMQLTDFFPPASRIVEDHRWLERHVGPLLPLEVVLRVDKSSSLSMLDKVELVHRVESAVRASEPSARTSSLATFLPRWEPPGGVRRTVLRTVANRRLEIERAQLASSTTYFVDTSDADLWRVNVRLPLLDGKGYMKKLADIREVVETVRQSIPAGQRPGVSVVYSGTLPLLGAAHKAILRDLIASLGVSMLSACVILTLGLRSIRLGIVSVLPNLFPVVVVFGTLGGLHLSIDVGTMMTAAVGLGIAVDNTVHFLTWFRRGLYGGRTRRQAIQFAYEHCGAAMFRTTAICSAGLLVYTMASFAPAARFGGVLCVLLLAALLGDLLFLPATLSSPLGKLLFPVSAPPDREP